MKKFQTKRNALILHTIIALLFTTIFPFAKPALAQSVTVTAQVDRPTVPINQTFNLTIDVSGANNVTPPDPFAIDGLQVVGTSQSQQISIVNGQQTAQISFIYIMQPTQDGTITIPPVTVIADGAEYTTNPVEVEITTVSSGTSGSNQSGRSMPSATSGNEVIIEAEVDNPNPYLGQQITYIFRYYRSVNLSSPDYAAPSFAGFWNQEETTQSSGNTQIDGRNYALVELRTILFPTVVGEQTIDPSQLTIQQGFFQPSIGLQTEPVVVNVQPHPTPTPANFSGTVGQFSIALELQTESGNSTNPLTVQLDEPVTARITLEGAGNFQTLQNIALPDLDEWRTFDSTSSTETNVTNGQLIGQLTVEQLIVPTKPGTFDIPPIDYHYFDPTTEQYQTISTEPLQIIVEGEIDTAANAQPAPLTDSTINSSAVERTGVERLDADIRHIKPAPATLSAATPFAQRPLFWALWLLPLLFIAGDWILQRRAQSAASDPVAARRSRALREAQRQLKQARSNKADPYSSSSDILTEYLSSKLNLPVSGLTQNALAQTLSAQNIEPTLIQQTQDLLTLSDMGQYAPVATQETSDDLLTNVEQHIKNLEKALTHLGKSDQSSRLLTLIIPLLLLGLLTEPLGATTHSGQPHQTSVDQMDQANQLYEASQFAEAVSIYQDLLADNVQDPALLFNLGNAHFKQGDIGRAILNYERAALLTPRDPDLRTNLALARTLLTDQYDAQPDTLLAQLSQLSARWLTRNQLAWIGLLLWFIVALLWIAHRRLSANKPTRAESTRIEATLYALIGSAILLICIMGLWGIRTYTEETRGQAIILAQEVNVLSGPGQQYITEFTLHSGSKVTLLENRGQWHRLSLPGNELQGWVPAEAIGLITIAE